MKECDLTAVVEQVDTLLQESEYLITDVCTVNQVELIVCNIYLASQEVKEVSTSFKDVIAVIATGSKIGIILDGRSSYYNLRSPLCTYQSLEEDVEVILEVIETVMQRIYAQQ